MRKIVFRILKRAQVCLAVIVQISFVISMPAVAAENQFDPEKLIRNIGTEGSRTLDDVAIFAELNCASPISKTSLEAGLRSLQQLPPNVAAVCLFPKLLSEYRKLLMELGSRESSPFDITEDFSALTLRTGAWKPKPFETNTADLNSSITRWVLVSEALRQNLDEIVEYFEKMPKRSSTLTGGIRLPIAFASLEKPLLVLRLNTFVRYSRCPPQQTACGEAAASIRKIVAIPLLERSAEIKRILQILDMPLAGTTEPEVQSLIDARAAARQLQTMRLEIRKSKLRTVEWLGSAFNKNGQEKRNFSKSISTYLDAIMAQGLIPKSMGSIDESMLARSLVSAIILTDLEELLLEMKSPSAAGKSEHAQTVRSELDTLLSDLSRQIESREKSL